MTPGIAENWPQHPLTPLSITAGPAAWRLPMLLGPHAAHALTRPSLLVVTPADEDALLAAAAKNLPDWPLLLIVDEPDFARRLAGNIRARIAALGRQRVSAVVLRVGEPSDLKAGGVLQTLFDLRAQSLFDHVGLQHDDILAVEWLAAHTAVRLLVLPYSLDDQSARYRALAVAGESGQACLTLAHHPDGDALRFALGDAARVLPVLARPIPPGLLQLTPEEIESAWTEYRTTHAEPPPLPRSRPPE